ncbi:MAG: rod shape-determining protein MreD [Thiolinea sp.]
MVESLPRFTGAVWVTMLISALLNNLPVAEEWAAWKPDWVALALVHCGLMIRQESSLMMAFFMGLLTDALSSSLMGQFAFGYVLVTYFAVRLGLRMTPEAFIQQMALIFIVIGVFMLLNLWIRGITGHASEGLTYWAPLLSSLIVWPFYHWALSYFYVQRKVA